MASALEWVVGRDVACGGQEPPRAKKGRRKRKGEGDRVEGSGGGRAGREGEKAVGPRKEEVWSVRWRKGKIGARCRRHEVWSQAASISFTVPDQQCYLFCAFASVCLVVVSHIISTGLGRQRQRWRRNMPTRCGARVTKRRLQIPAKRSHNCDECLPDGDIRRVLTEAALQLTEAQRQMGVVFIKENEWQKQIYHKTQQLTVAQEDRDRAFAAHVDCASQMTSCTRC